MEILETYWDQLEPHFKRDALFAFSDLSFEEVFDAVAKDKKDIVASWLEEKRLFKIEKDYFEATLVSHKETKFSFIIVAPFVFVQKADNNLLI